MSTPAYVDCTFGNLLYLMLSPQTQTGRRVKGLFMCRYTDQDFDAEFIHILQQACQKYIDNEREATLEEVADFIRTKVGQGKLCFRNF